MVPYNPDFFSYNLCYEYVANRLNMEVSINEGPPNMDGL